MNKKFEVAITDGVIDLVRPFGFESDSEDDFWFYITLHDTDIIIGEIIYDDTYRNVEKHGNIGYCIYKNYQGHNYAAKALTLLKKILEGKKEKMIINIFEDNIASIKTATSFGARLVKKGTLEEKYVLDKENSYSYNYFVYEYNLGKIIK